MWQLAGTDQDGKMHPEKHGGYVQPEIFPVGEESIQQRSVVVAAPGGQCQQVCRLVSSPCSSRTPMWLVRHEQLHPKQEGRAEF